MCLQKRAYKLAAWEDAHDFLDQVARGSGKLTRGGEADINTAARMVLLDWQRGRLPSFRLPPGYDTAAEGAAVVAEATPETAGEVEDGAAAEAGVEAGVEAGEEGGHGDAGEEEVTAEAQEMARVAATAARDQCAGMIPVRGEFFDAEDLGDGAVDELVVSEDDVSEDEVSLDSGADGSEGSGAASGEEAAGAGAGDDKSDEDGEDEAGGYGEEGLGWEAVLGDVLGEVRRLSQCMHVPQCMHGMHASKCGVVNLACMRCVCGGAGLAVQSGWGREGRQVVLVFENGVIPVRSGFPLATAMGDG